MAFQFMCPQGHVLQGDEAHAGQAVQCPQCGTMFVIPSPGDLGPSPSPPVSAAPPPPEEETDEFGLPVIGRRGGRFSFLEEGGSEGSDLSGTLDGVLRIVAVGEGPRAAFDPLGGSGPRLVTIPCPNGHTLQMPFDSMGREILCPHCGEQFVLRYTDSVEYHREVEAKQSAREHKLGKQWLTWAVVASVAVVVLLLSLIAAAHL